MSNKNFLRELGAKTTVSKRKYGFEALTNSRKFNQDRFVDEHRNGILRGLLFILLVFMIVGVMTNGDSYNGMLSFRGFLALLEECPMIPTDWLSFGSDIPDSVTSIPFIGSVVEFFTQLVSVLMFFVVGISNAIWMILYFLYRLFS